MLSLRNQVWPANAVQCGASCDRSNSPLFDSGVWWTGFRGWWLSVSGMSLGFPAWVSARTGCSNFALGLIARHWWRLDSKTHRFSGTTNENARPLGAIFAIRHRCFTRNSSGRLAFPKFPCQPSQWRVHCAKWLVGRVQSHPIYKFPSEAHLTDNSSLVETSLVEKVKCGVASNEALAFVTAGAV